MKTRMDKYDENTSILRSEKNKRLYDEVSDMNIDYVDIDVNNVIDLSSNKKTGAREEYKKQRELNYFMPNEKKSREYIDNTLDNKEDRVYDINEILKLAKENKLFDSDSSKKRMINTEYNILTKLDLDEVTNKEYLHELIDTIYEKEKTTKKKENILYEKEDLSSSDDLLNLKEDTVNLNEDISKDILDKTVTEVVPKVEIDEENEEEQEDKKEDTNTVNEMTDTIEIDETISKKLLFIIIFVLILLGVSAYIILKYFNII